MFDDYLKPRRRKIIWQTITHITSCIHAYVDVCEFFNEIVSFTFSDFFFHRVFFSTLFVFQTSFSTRGYYNINKTPYENQVLKAFLFFVAVGVVVVMMKL